MNNRTFINKLTDLNQIFKNIYNDLDKFENIWTIDNGRFYMYNKHQFPSFIEIFLNPDVLVTSKGALNTQGKDLKEFLKSVDNTYASINAIKLFNLCKYLDKDAVKDINISEDKIGIDGNIITEPKIVDVNFLEHDVDDIIGEFTLSQEMINELYAKGNNPFKLTFEFDCNSVLDGDNVLLDEDPRLDSFLTIKLANKFLPYIIPFKETKTNKLKSTVDVTIYLTECDYMYDVEFKVKQYKAGKSGVFSELPLSVEYRMRVCDI